MTPDGWLRVKTIVHDALERRASERAAFVAAACGGDRDLQVEVEALLLAHERAGTSFLQPLSPAAVASMADAVDRAARALRRGDRLGPYEVVDALGAGGMGEVYRARDTRLNRAVAIKVLPSHVAQDPQARQRFEREARAIAALNHPHICTLHDIGHHESTGSGHTVDYLVMEYLEGETLAARLEQGALPIAQALHYAMQIAAALDKAHHAGILHRDLKPANVMLTKSGAKLLDFGIAKASITVVAHGTAPAPETGMTTPGTILGTVHYMAPEQLQGKDADRRSDIWALGAVIYEMVAGRKPFAGDTAASVIGAILRDDPPPLSTVQPFSPVLDHVVGRCLAKDPDERWQHAGDVRHELMWALSAGQQAAPMAAPATRGLSRLGWPVAVALAIALAVTMPSAVRRWLAPPPDASSVQFTVLPPDGVAFTAANAAVPTTQLAISPDGRHLAFVAATSSGRPMLWIRSLDSMQARALSGTEEASSPFWSPDSRFVGFFSLGKLRKIDLVGGTPQALCDASSSDNRGGTWNRNGVILFAPNSASGLLQVSDAGGQPAPAIPLREGDSSYRWPSFLPDGRQVLFYVRSSADRQGLYIASIGETTFTRLLDATFNGVYSMGHVLTLRDGSLLAYPFDEAQRRIVGNPLQVAERVGGTTTALASLSVSANGVLAYGGALTTSTRLTWFDRAGRAQGAATERGDYTTFRFSTDERRLAFTQVDAVSGTTQDVWLMDVARGIPTRFTSDRFNDISPVWSPDGRQIAFRSDRAGGNFPFVKPSTGGEPERMLAPIEAGFPTDWSPDGRFLLYYATLPVTGWDVMALPMSGDATPIAIAQSTFAEASGRFSPNGRWIAYSSDESGQSEIYVQPFLQAGSKVRVTTGGGFEPRWRRDGRELFFLATDGAVTAVPVSATATFESGTPRRLFQTQVPYLGSHYRSRYEVVGDEPRFLVNTFADRPLSPPITVVLNWTAGLRQQQQ